MFFFSFSKNKNEIKYSCRFDDALSNFYSIVKNYIICWENLNVFVIFYAREMHCIGS